MTVRRELNSKLSKLKFALPGGKHRYKELIKIYGGTHHQNEENQYEINIMNDINQIEFVLWCLNNREALESKRMLMIEKEKNEI